MLPTYHPEFEVWMLPHEILEVIGGPLDGDLVGCPAGQPTVEVTVVSTQRIAQHKVEGCYAIFTGYSDERNPTS